MTHYAQHGNFSVMRQPQEESPNETFTCMSEELLKDVHQKLADQKYAHYVD